MFTKDWAWTIKASSLPDAFVNAFHVLTQYA